MIRFLLGVGVGAIAGLFLLERWLGPPTQTVGGVTHVARYWPDTESPAT
jgi:hypothetical protein